MKKYIFNLLFLTTLLVGCNNDNPNYSEITLSTDVVELDINGSTKVDIVQGNGNYIVKSKDSKIATAVVQGDELLITAISRGKTTLQLTDWAKKTTNLTVLVHYETTDELILAETSATIDEKKRTSFHVFEGNAMTHLDYKVSSSDENIVIVVEQTEDEIKIEGVAPGQATITVTDEKGLTADFEVTVRPMLRELIVDATDAIFFHYQDGDAIINILDGNGDYEVSMDYPGVNATLDGQQITLSGSKEMSAKLTIKDGRGQTKEIVVISFGDFLGNKQTRSFYSRKFVSAKYSKATMDPLSGRSTIKASTNAGLDRGEVLSFPGDCTTVGKREHAEFKNVTKIFWSVYETVYEVSDLEVVKSEDNTVWITFQCEGEPAYMVVNL